LKFSEQQVMVWQEYQNLVLVASLVFGKQGADAGGAQPPRNADEAQAQIDRLLGKK
jgi:hypothetical protein